MKQYDAYIVGYYGMQNTGDDALLYATIEGAKRYLGCERILVTSRQRNAVVEQGCTSSIIREPQRFKGQNRLCHYANAWRSKRVILIGGSVLQSATDSHLKRHLVQLAGAKQSMALGVGIEPFATQQDQDACVKFLNTCGLTAVRDQQSYDIAREIAPSANIVNAFDLAPSILNYYSVNKPASRRGIGINLCGLATSEFSTFNLQRQNARLEAIYEAILSIWQHTHQIITLISFNGHAKQGDHLINQQVMVRLAGKMPIMHEAYNADPLAVIDRIAQFRAVLGMRRHCKIFSYMTQTPCLSVNYDPKSVAWCKQIGLPTRCQIDVNRINALEITNKMLGLLTQQYPQPKLRLDNALLQTAENWRTVS